MSVYMFNAAFYCERCGAGLPHPPATATGIYNDGDFDSNEFAISYPDAGEADSPQHCDECGVMLDHSLTEDGIEYVREALADGTGNPDVLNDWRELLAAHGG